MQSRVRTVTLIAPPAPAVAPSPIALQSPRQLDGIPHANPAAPPLVGMGRVSPKMLDIPNWQAQCFFMKSRKPEESLDEAIIANARQFLKTKGRFRWLMLGYAAMFLGIAGYLTYCGILKVKGLDEEQLKPGFINGFAIAIVWTTFGTIGALCLGKFLQGFTPEFRKYELLVTYHDLLRDLGQLPNATSKDDK